MGVTKELYNGASEGRRSYHNALHKLAIDGGHRFRATIYGSARVSRESSEFKKMSVFAGQLAYKNIDVITGGGPGEMEAANLGAHTPMIQRMISRKKGRSIGVPLRLPKEKEPNGHTDVCFMTEDFGYRLDLFGAYGTCHIYADRAGIGTTYELLHFLQLHQIQKKQGMVDANPHLFPLHPSVQLGYIPKMIAVGSIYDKLIDFFEVMTNGGMFDMEEIDFLTRAKDYDEALKIVLQEKKLWKKFLQKKGIKPLN